MTVHVYTLSTLLLLLTIAGVGNGCAAQVDREEREWCAGLPTHVFEPWVQRLVGQHTADPGGSPPGITAPPLPVRCVQGGPCKHSQQHLVRHAFGCLRQQL